MHEWHRTLRTHVGKGLPHEGFILMGAGHLHQHHLVGNLHRFCRQALFQLHHVFWSPWKGLIKERLKRRELPLGDRGSRRQQDQHSWGHLLMEGNAVCPKAMLIFLLCHLQGHPLCSNAPCKDDLPERTVWLVIKRTLGAHPTDSFYISNAPASAPLRLFVWLS